MRCLLILLVAAAILRAQKPVIAPGGVVNAASYVAGGLTGKALSPASLVSIFGSNLASTKQVASAFPLPTTLGGTSVTMNGVPMPILYVSPNQINLQLSTVSVSNPPPAVDPVPIVVVTAGGASDPAFLPIDVGGPFGIFTLDSSGCGRGAAFNIADDGSLSLNSPSNSAEPGSLISIYGTGVGAVYNPPPAGMPALSDPLSQALNWSVFAATFDLPPSFPSTALRTKVSWAGRAPGLVGVDRVDIRIPDTVREGCSVPLIIEAGKPSSQPVPVSIRKGGGACVDPPTAAYGLITWEKALNSGSGPGSVTETFTAAFPASPGKQPPPPLEYADGRGYARITETSGPSCPLPGYTSLDAGTVTIQGPGFGPVEAAPATVNGQRVYQTVLPNGTIRPGPFGVAVSGSTDLEPFQSSVGIGSGINITSSFPSGTVLRSGPIGGTLPVNWKGGDPDTWVTVKLVIHLGATEVYAFTQAPASKGNATLDFVLPTGPAEIIVEVTPDPAQVPVLAAAGLRLGGQHLWKYAYRFAGLTLQ